MLVIRLCGGVEVEADGRLLPDALLAGRQGRLVLAYLACAGDRAVPREDVAELLWPDRLPDSWPTSLSAVVSRLRRLFTEAGLDGQSTLVSTQGTYRLLLPAGSQVDWLVARRAIEEAERAMANGDGRAALAGATEAAAVAERGFLVDDCHWVDEQRAAVADVVVRAALVRAEAHLLLGSPARAVETARNAVRRDPLREAGYRILMGALAANGERAEALRVWELCRATLVEELGTDPSPDTEAVYLGILGVDSAKTTEPASTTPGVLPSGVVTFLLTDIVGSSSMWDIAPEAMANAIDRHDELVEQVVAGRGGKMLKSKLEGDATVSVFARATAGAAAALDLLIAIEEEPWPEQARPRLRMALHTGEAVERRGDYFGPALNRAARLRSLAGADQVLLSQAIAELVRDHLPDDVTLADLGHRDLRGLSRGENVYELRRGEPTADEPAAATPFEVPPLPRALIVGGHFVGREEPLARLSGAWDRASNSEAGAVLLAGEPGVGKSRLATEFAARVSNDGAVVLYGRCDEELGAPLAPFVEAARPLAVTLGESRLRSVPGVDELGRVLPEVAAALGSGATPSRADPDTERQALFDAITQLLVTTSAEAPVLLVLDDLHWAGKTTLSLLRHLLRHAGDARLLVIGTYRDTELSRTHPLAATLADLHRDGTAQRIPLTGLAPTEVAAYVAAAGHHDHALGRELAKVTSGNPFFLIETLRHVEESGGAWDPGTLPQGVREATGRRLSGLTEAANEALSVAAVTGTTFDLELVEQVQGRELLDEVAEACQAGLLVEEGTHGRFRFAHALVRQVLLAELVTVKRVRLHRRIAELLEAAAGDDSDSFLTDLAYHWFECSAAGNADKAIDYCRRAADRAMGELAYEEAADLYGMAISAIDSAEVDARDEVRAELLLSRCDALLTAGEAGAARSTVAELDRVSAGDDRLRAWSATYSAQLAVLGEPDRLDEVVGALGSAAAAMQAAGDRAGEAKAHYVHALALERLGRIGQAERTFDVALAAARAADDRRLQDAILAGAPVAALWGPSPVTRASGRCLDVVRVLRITNGAPAVEAVALRCQAALEALRGRMDAARRMIGSAHRTIEELGLAHRLLENEMTAGLIELLDGQAAIAEEHLRPAFEALRDRGLDGEAGQAGSMLARALLIQGRREEAEEVAAEARRLGGADLKAAVAWRGVVAEMAADRGDREEAISLATAAVELATATDSLLLEAQARLALTTVYRSLGDTAAAAVEAERAVAACEAKGATVLTAVVRAASQPRPPSPPATASAVADERHPQTTATRAFERLAANFAARDFEAMQAGLAPEFQAVDRRSLVGRDMTASAYVETLRLLAEHEFVFTLSVRATRGDRLVLNRVVISGGDSPSETSFLDAAKVDASGRSVYSVFFDDDAEADALAELDRLFADDSPVLENDAIRGSNAFVEAWNRGDWDGVRAQSTDDWRLDDRRRIVGVDQSTSASLNTQRLAFESGARYESTPLAIRGEHLALARQRMLFDGAEIEMLIVIRSRDGRRDLAVMFDPEDLDTATAELERLYLEEQRDAELTLENKATRYLDRAGQAFRNGDLDEVRSFVGTSIATVDRRSGPSVDLDPALMHETVSVLIENGASWAAETLATGGECFALSRVIVTNDDPPLEFPFLALIEVDELGSGKGAVIFDADDLDSAYAELDRLLVEERATEQRSWDTKATRYQAHFKRAFDAGDPEAFLSVVSPTYEVMDRRSGVNADLDAGQYEQMMRMLVERRAIWIAEMVATRGDYLALFSITVRNDDPVLELPMLVVNEVDDEERPTRTVLFDPDDLNAAYDELDDLFAAGEAAPLADLWESARATTRAYGNQAFDQIRIRDDFVLNDHRRVSFGVRNFDEWTESVSEYAALAGGLGIRIDHVLGLRERGIVLVQTRRGALQDGGVWESTVILVSETDPDRRAIQADVYDIDQRDQAMARFAELSTPPEPRFANRAIAFVNNVRAVDRSEGWAAVAPLLAPGFVGDDRRAFAQVRKSGPDFFRPFFDLADMEIESRSEWLATRGERLVLHRVRVEVHDKLGGIDAAEVLVLDEVDVDGRCLTEIYFDVDDLDAAYAELDARYAAGEAAPYAERWLGMVAFGRVYGSADLAAVADGMADDFVLVDHRPVGWGTTDKEGYLGHLAVLHDLSPDAVLRFDHALGICARGTLMVTTTHGDRLGGDYEIPMLAVNEYDDAGRFARLDFFPLDQLDAARARFAEVEAGANAIDATSATRTLDLTYRFSREHDWDALAALFAPGPVVEDRRALFARIWEADDVVATAKFTFNKPGVRMDAKLIAAYGDRIAIDRRRMYDESSEVELLGVVEVDEDGQILAYVQFDLDAIGAAIDEAASRYIAGEGAPFRAVVEPALEFVRAARDRDRNALQEVLAEDVVGLDHRAGINLDVAGRDAYVDSVSVLWQLVSDLELIPESIEALNESGIVTRGLFSGRLGDGGSFDQAVLAVFGVADGQIVTADWYDVEDLDAALARFAEFERGAIGIRPNLAARTRERLYAATEARDWDEFETFVHPDAIINDRRPMFGHVGDARSLMEVTRYATTRSSLRLEHEFLAVLGERLVVDSCVYVDDEVEIPFLTVTEVDDDGRVVELVVFEGDDRRAAQEEAWDRFIRGEGAPSAHVLEPAVTFARAVQDRDRDRLRGVLAHDLLTADHRPGRHLEGGGADAYVDSVAVLSELVSDFSVISERIEALDERGIVVRARWTGLLSDGGPFDDGALLVFGITNGQIATGDWFDVADLDAALARFAQLGPKPFEIEPNRASRVSDSVTAAITTADWRTFRSLCNAEVVFDSRRRFGHGSVGGEPVLEELREFATTKGLLLEPSSTLIATAGDRLALVHRTWAGSKDGGPIAWAHLEVVEVDGDGFMSAVVSFDEDQRPAAFTELYRRFHTPEHLHHPEVMAELAAGIRSGDVARLKAMMTPDAWVVDHRRVGIGEMAAAEYFDGLTALHEIAAEVEWEMTQVLRDTPKGTLTTVRFVGTLQNGGSYESELASISVYGATGRIQRIELYEVDDLPQALARFAEIEHTTPDFSAIEPTTATRVSDVMTAAITTGDWDAFRAVCAADMVFDTRVQLGGGVVGREAVVASVEMLATREGVVADLESTLLATAGERLVLHHREWTGVWNGGPWNNENFDIIEIDDKGLIIAIVTFGDGDRRAAFTELYRRFHAPEHSVRPPAVGEITEAVRSGDASRYLELIDEGARIIDHRRIGVEMTAAEHVDVIETYDEFTTETDLEVTQVLRETPGAALTTNRWIGVLRDGGSYEIDFVSLVLNDEDGRATHIELFDIDDLPRALARFDELTTAQ